MNPVFGSLHKNLLSYTSVHSFIKYWHPLDLNINLYIISNLFNHPKFFRQQYRSRLTKLVVVAVKRNVNIHAALRTASRNLHTQMIKEFEDQERISSDSSDFLVS